MQGGQQIDYEATYRRTERVLPGLLGVLAAFLGGVFAVIRYADWRRPVGAGYLLLKSMRRRREVLRRRAGVTAGAQ